MLPHGLVLSLLTRIVQMHCTTQIYHLVPNVPSLAITDVQGQIAKYGWRPVSDVVDPPTHV
jgi:hypothetical protein